GESGPAFDDLAGSVPPSVAPPPARLAVAPPMRAPAVVVPAVAADIADLEFEDSDSLEVEEEEEIVFDEEVEQLEPAEFGVLSARPQQPLPSNFPSSVPPGQQWPARASSQPAAAARAPSLPPLPSLPSPRRGSSAPPPSGGFDTAFLDSLDDEQRLPAFPDQAEIEFGDEPPTRQIQPSMVDLPARARVVTPSLPIDRTTAAEYAQRSQARRPETPEDIEHELGVDLSLGTTRPPPQDLRERLAPTPGRASVRSSGPPTVPTNARG